MATDANYTALTLEVVGKNTDAIKSLQDVRQALEQLREVSTAIRGVNFSQIRENMSNVTQAINELNNINVDSNRLAEITRSLEEIERVSERISNIANNSGAIREIVNSVNEFNRMNLPVAEMVQQQTQPIANPQLTDAAYRIIGSPFQNVETNNSRRLNFSGITDFLSNVTSGFRNARDAITNNFLARGLRTVTNYVKGEFTGVFQGAVKSIRSFTSSLGRIALYRGIRSIIKNIMSGISEGLQNVYQWSKLTGNQFANSMDSIATSSMYAKNSLGAMAAPLFNSLAPVIDAIVNKFVSLINVINQVFAVLTGSTTWIKAKKQAQEFAAGVTGSAGSAKKAIDLFLASFDELNVIPAQKDSSGGSGGASVPDYSSMFETETVDSGIKNFIDSIKANIENGDWKSIGRIFGNKVNGIIDAINFEDAGRNFGYKLNGIIQTGYYFLDTVNFYNIAKGFANFLNGALYEVDFTYIGATMMKKFAIIGDLLIGFFTNLDYGQIAIQFSRFIIGALDEGTRFIKKYDWGSIGSTIALGISDFIANMDYLGVVMSLGTFLWNAITGVGSAAIGFVSTLIGELCGYAVDWLMSPRSAGDAVNGLFEFIRNTFSGVLTVMFSIPQWVNDNIITPFVNGFKKGWDSSGGSMSEKVSNTWDNIKQTTGSIWDSIKNSLTGNWSSTRDESSRNMKLMRSDISFGWDSISKSTSSTWNSIEGVMGDKTSNIKGGVSSAWENMKGTVSSVWSNMKTSTSNTWSNISSSLNSVIGGIKANVASWFTQIYNTASKTWNNIKNSIVNPITSAKNTISGIVSTIKGMFNFKINWPYVPMPHFGITPSGWKVSDLLKGSIPRLSVSFYENGGLPDVGEMFMARENGPELVGRIGNKSAVANNAQIVEAVEGGVYRGVRDAMIASSDSSGGNINLVIKLDGSVIYKDFVKRNNKKVAMTGQSDLLF